VEGAAVEPEQRATAAEQQVPSTSLGFDSAPARLARNASRKKHSGRSAQDDTLLGFGGVMNDPG